MFEADINPIFRYLSDTYLDTPAPDLHVTFLDIEVDFDVEKGFSSPEDPFSQITAISFYRNWLDNLTTYVLAPKTLNYEQAVEIASRFENTYVMKDEKELLINFLNDIQDTDLFTGWNSEGYDLPYLVNRISKVLGKDYTRLFCLWNMFPTKKEYERFGKTQISYDLHGMIHIDYMDLYKKHSQKALHTYALDFVGELEIQENKVKYDGHIDKLYNDDFEKFIGYNRQDVMIIVKLDRKKKYINLANHMAHQNGVLITDTLGTVKMTDNAIVNEAHRRKLIVLSKPDRDEETRAAGAYVADPRIGLHKWIGIIDIKSLYPSTLRALNMGPETIVGQIRQDYTNHFLETRIKEGNLYVSVHGVRHKNYSEAWHDIFAAVEYDMVMRRDKELPMIIDYENGTSVEMTGDQIYRMIFESDKKLILSANGTIFKSDFDAIIPGLLARWYQDRQDMQKKAKAFKAKAETEQDLKKKREYEAEYEYWDLLQLLRKVNLNALYGALLNEGSKFYDKRLGQSVTLTGRSISKHMNSKVNEVITGIYQHDGEAVIYVDTDSSQFSAYEPMKKKDIDFEWTKENVIELYDLIADEVNHSFPEFMNRAFNTGLERGSIISCSRELVGQQGLYTTKKRYAILYYDKEGFRTDTNGKPGELKIMGLDIKRSDTPKVIQDFLERLVLQILSNEGDDTEKEAQLKNSIFEFRVTLKQLLPWEKGTPKAVNNLTKFTKFLEEGQKARVPGHATASINWNRLMSVNGDNRSKKITDGDKIIVCKLKSNPLGINSIAYPFGERLPDWFKQLPFDEDLMEKTILEKKLHNLFGVLKWDLTIGANQHADSLNTFFSFD